MSDSENKSKSSEESSSESHEEAKNIEHDSAATIPHVDDGSESSDESEKQSDTSSEHSKEDPPNNSPPPAESGNVDRPAETDDAKLDSNEKNEPSDKPKDPEPESTKPSQPSEKPAVSFSEPSPHEKHASDPSPEARALRGEDDSDGSEQFFTPTATPPIVGHEISSRTMTEAEEEELARLRSERNTDNRRRNAFYGGNQESEQKKKKIGLDPNETIAEPAHSNSGIATKEIIRCTLGKQNDKLKSRSARITVAYADTQGRRPSMEDDFVFIGQFRSDPHLDLIGLFDGHRGTSASRYAARELSAVVDEQMKHNPKPRDALHESFLALHKQMKGDDIQTGTTAIVSLLTANKFFIANAGDSRAVLCRGEKAIRLTTDHRPDCADEIARITKLGGDIQDVVTKDGKVISRVAGLLGVSRALGDFDLEPYVTAQPEVAEFSWGPEEPENRFVIVACDGLWECVQDQEAVDIAKHFVKNVDAEAACKRLRDVAFARGSTDNISVCLIVLHDEKESASKTKEPSSSSQRKSSSSSSSSADAPTKPSDAKTKNPDPATDAGNTKPSKRRRCAIL